MDKGWFWLHYHLQCYSDTSSFLSLFSFLLPPSFSYSHSYSILILLILLMILLYSSCCSPSFGFLVMFLCLSYSLSMYFSCCWFYGCCCFWPCCGWACSIDFGLYSFPFLNACKATLPWQNSSVLLPNLTASMGSRTTGSSSDLTTVHCTAGKTANKKRLKPICT